jgi:hypothetical protein
MRRARTKSIAGPLRESEKEAIELVRNRYLDDLCEDIKYVKLHYKGYWLDNDDGYLWHFTRFSVLRQMLAGRQLWLSDLAFSNDVNELAYGLSRAVARTKAVSKHWDRRTHADAVCRIADQSVRRWARFHVYGFCFWNIATPYSTGMHTVAAFIRPG